MRLRDTHTPQLPNAGLCPPIYRLCAPLGDPTPPSLPPSDQSGCGLGSAAPAASPAGGRRGAVPTAVGVSDPSAVGGTDGGQPVTPPCPPPTSPTPHPAMGLTAALPFFSRIRCPSRTSFSSWGGEEEGWGLQGGEFGANTGVLGLIAGWCWERCSPGGHSEVLESQGGFQGLQRTQWGPGKDGGGVRGGRQYITWRSARPSASCSSRCRSASPSNARSSPTRPWGQQSSYRAASGLV